MMKKICSFDLGDRLRATRKREPLGFCRNSKTGYCNKTKTGWFWEVGLGSMAVQRENREGQACFILALLRLLILLLPVQLPLMPRRVSYYCLQFSNFVQSVLDKLLFWALLFFLFLVFKYGVYLLLQLSHCAVIIVKNH